MKWKTPPVPKENDTRFGICFAFQPIECSDGYTRWLCFYKVKQQYEYVTKWAGCHYKVLQWVDKEFLAFYS